MHQATSVDVLVVLVVVGSRLFVPLLIPLYPLPAIVTALVVDGVDQTLFQALLSDAFWHDIEHGYQGYDKALDIYYLCVAYTATMRNWTHGTALRCAQFLWLYRLSGVTLFQVVHDPADESSWRWLLLVFPNTFEYFFIAYEAVRLRWDPRRMSPRLVVGIAAFIWAFIKLPQEWWIHVARLDFTDFAREHSWVIPTLAALLILLLGLAWWALTYRLPPRDHPLRLHADPLPRELDTAHKRNVYRMTHLRLVDWYLAEKVAIVTLVCVNFAEILPGTAARPSQVVVAVGVLVVINSFLGMAFSRRNWSAENAVLQFTGLASINLGLVWSARAATPRFDPNNAMFFVLLISLIVLLYDRYRPIRDLRWAC
jgi:hypothetical protein